MVIIEINCTFITLSVSKTFFLFWTYFLFPRTGVTFRNSNLQRVSLTSFPSVLAKTTLEAKFQNYIKSCQEELLLGNVIWWDLCNGLPYCETVTVTHTALSLCSTDLVLWCW